ncbi:flagellar protein FlaG [Gorillibacterium massiliense]|uniref:flagellar protein FlaG n=1 Tax=Gorillibacterium massiliense TaxID=1280390 RepID=UPI000693821C|nr:flagellar protein FlaG [Gorillibacterium massiliense]
MMIQRMETVSVEKVRPGESYSTVSKTSRVEQIPKSMKSESSEKPQEFSGELQKKLEEQVRKLNESIASSGKELKFKYNDEAKQLYVEVIDAKTKEVVTSLPPEFLIDLSMKMKEMIGMFLDKKV